MEWKDTKLGQFIDEKVKYFNFKNTLIVCGPWRSHENNMKAFKYIGQTYWFSLIMNDSADVEENYLTLYCIRINNEEHKELAFKIFEEYVGANYARYYKGLEAIESYGKKFL